MKRTNLIGQIRLLMEAFYQQKRGLCIGKTKRGKAGAKKMKEKKKWQYSLI